LLIYGPTWPKGLKMHSEVLPPFTPGIRHANETQLWQSPIEKESFEKMVNDPLHRDYFIAKGWDKPESITYKINSHGFRCEEFDDTPCLVALGCSFTFGVGLPVQDTWPSLVGKALGLKVVNLSWGGQGPDYCFRMAEYWLSRLPAKRCVMLTPPSSRIEVVTEDAADTLLPGSLSSHYNPNDWFLNTWMMNTENHRLNRLKNILAIRQLCADLNIPCQIYESMKEFSKSREELEYARDYMHAGPLGHKLLAEKIINEY